MWKNQQFPADLVTFTEEIFNENLHYLCSELRSVRLYQQNLWIWEVVSFYWEKFTILDNFSQLKDLFKESYELYFMEIRVFLLIITSYFWSGNWFDLTQFPAIYWLWGLTWGHNEVISSVALR